MADQMPHDYDDQSQEMDFQEMEDVCTESEDTTPTAVDEEEDSRDDGMTPTEGLGLGPSPSDLFLLTPPDDGALEMGRRDANQSKACDMICRILVADEHIFNLAKEAADAEDAKVAELERQRVELERQLVAAKEAQKKKHEEMQSKHQKWMMMKDISNSLSMYLDMDLPNLLVDSLSLSPSYAQNGDMAWPPAGGLDAQEMQNFELLIQAAEGGNTNFTNLQLAHHGTGFPSEPVPSDMSGSNYSLGAVNTGTYSQGSNYNSGAVNTNSSQCFQGLLPEATFRNATTPGADEVCAEF